MIRRDISADNGRPGWLLVPQIAHAELAGALADVWRLDGIPEDLAGDLRWAIHRHDDGWADWDSRPGVDPQSGRPIEFDEMRLADSLPIWTLSIDEAAARRPIQAYFVAGHFTRLLRRFDSWRGDAAREDLARGFLTEQNSNMELWLAAWQNGSSSLPNGARQSTAERGVDGLQFFDAVSLWFCCAERQAPERIELAPGEGWTFSPLGVEQGWRLVRIEPWPLTVESCQLAVSGRVVPRAHYQSTDEMLAVATAKELELRCGVVR